ncbi:hypothetical protein AAES_122569 [Amazona aestiva]|uniref:Uncharacterized protein n=1 Tax=Amazona aestiva TaxID=12930 RepID=A0A0Q3M5L4_AMAAE|nr:hypothetical protein AAES_122569 [Amazona aestiva]
MDAAGLRARTAPPAPAEDEEAEEGGCLGEGGSRGLGEDPSKRSWRNSPCSYKETVISLEPIKKIKKTKVLFRILTSSMKSVFTFMANLPDQEVKSKN